MNPAPSVRVLATILVLAAGGACACSKGEETVLTGPGASFDAMAPVPHDHLAPGELLPGTETAFGLTLPRGSRIESTFPQQIIAACDAKPADVANYVRRHVSMGVVKVGAAATMWDGAQVAARPGRELTIKVEEGPTGAGTRMTLRDVTPPPFNPNLTDEQRWRQAGVAPGGKLIDPTHLQ